MPWKRSQYPRVKNEFYCEPRWADELLLDVEQFTGTVLDPFCGSGTIPSVCLSRGIAAIGSDIMPRGFGDVADFFTRTEPVDNIVSNVPYSRAEQCLRHALNLARHKVALILPISFLESQCRDDLFERFPPSRVWIFARRPSMPPGNMSATERDEHGAIIQPEGKGGMTPFSWFVWEIGYRGPMIIKRLPRAPLARRAKLMSVAA